MSHCLLDVLAVELIHIVFSYLLPHEIFLTFTNVSQYLNSILHCYSCNQLNLKSIRKCHFDLVCRRIRADQVRSLILADDKDTPGQAQLFLSYFRIEQFTRLESLTLIYTDCDCWEPIITNLSKLNQLRSFQFVNSVNRKDLLPQLYHQNLFQLEQRLFDHLDSVLPQLNRLRILHGNHLKSIPLPLLHHLTIEQCSVEIFERICKIATRLKFLKMTVEYQELDIKFQFPMPHLIQLNLKIENITMMMNDLEQLLSNLPLLKHLEIQTTSSNDFTNGYRLQGLTNRLATFNFKFLLWSPAGQINIDSFRTRFWIKEKRWFVAYQYGSLFSVPRFIDRTARNNFLIPPISTIPDPAIFYDHITEVTFRGSHIDWEDRNSNYARTRNFHHVETLYLEWSIKLSSLEAVLDFTILQRLIVSPYVAASIVRVILSVASRLKYVSIASNVRELFDQIGDMEMKQIQTLDIGGESNDNYDWSIGNLYPIFPLIERFNMTCRCSIMNVINLINGFVNLSSASFYYGSCSMTESEREQYHFDLKSALDRRNQLKNSTYSLRFDQTHVYLWLGDELKV